MEEIIDKIDTLSHLISPRRDINKPIYNWHSFKHSYSKELVDVFITEFNLKKGDWVLDPFCGGGTTLLACKQAGMNAHGFDILPFSVFLSNVKTGDYNIDMLYGEKERFERYNKPIQQVGKFPDILIIKKAFTPETERELFQIKFQIEQISDTNTRNFFNLALLSILESVSNTSKSGGFLRLVDRKVNTHQIKKIFLNKISEMIRDIETSKSNEGTNTILAFHGDAREIPSELLYDAIITSPPYPNRHDYTRIYSLEMIFDFVKDNDELKKIRYETLRSHVEARKKFESVGYTTPSILNKLMNKIKVNGVNNPQVIGMLAGYFEDMFLVLSEMKRCLKKNGKIALVVSNVRFAGINIPVDEILFEIGEQAGLKRKNILLARYRGNSSQQMKTYERIPSRESIIIWEN
jgi:DNA modification methylase